ncbi:MAG: hypothetical protein ABIS27_14550 [Longimicrobiales bacterium]
MRVIKLMLRARDGYAVVEGIVVLGLSVLIGAALSAALLTQSRLARAVAERIAHNDAARMTLLVLPREIRLADPDRDVRASSADSLAGRWVRSSGTICASQGNLTWLRLRGIRAPDPAKDSLLLVSSQQETVHVLSAFVRDQAHCAASADEQIYRTTLSATPPDGAVAMIFESGTYYLSQRALRYRLGGEGRQPLTEEFLRDGLSTLQLVHADSSNVARFRISITLKPGLQYSTGRTEGLTVILPNGRAGS